MARGGTFVHSVRNFTLTHRRAMLGNVPRHFHTSPGERVESSWGNTGASGFGVYRVSAFLVSLQRENFRFNSPARNIDFLSRPPSRDFGKYRRPCVHKKSLRFKISRKQKATPTAAAATPFSINQHPPNIFLRDIQKLATAWLQANGRPRGAEQYRFRSVEHEHRGNPATVNSFIRSCAAREY